MNVKWLRRIKVTEQPTMTKDETSKYTISLPDGKALQFVFPIEAKSVITHPSPGLAMKGARALRDIGACLVRLRQDRQGRCLCRWREKLGAGGPSGAGVGESADPLPCRLALERRPRHPAEPRDRRIRAMFSRPVPRLIAERGMRTIYHFNGIASWAVGENGEVTHVYA